ncbi:MAG: FAD-dependent oxidoreductase [Thermoanaerobaculia bacterium]
MHEPRAGAPAKPILLAVDDDADVLEAVGRDLRDRYRDDYMVLKARSGEEALQAVSEAQARSVPVALFLVDQRMPGMTGTELLKRLVKLSPDSRRVLLTAYADTDAAISSINEIGLDHYLLKPWHPPEMRLYPVLDDLLGSWRALHRRSWEGIRLAGTSWSRSSYEAKEFLARNQVPYQWLDVEREASVRELIERQVGDLRRLPVVLFPDGSHLAKPTPRELAERVGLRTRAERRFYDLVIVGGGPAGLANAVYGASEGLSTLLVERSAPGGQAGTSSRIENYLGFPNGVSGEDLARRAAAQARRLGAELLTAQEVVGIRREDPYRILRLADGTEISSYAVLVATGTAVRTLDVPGIERHLGAGVYYGAATTEMSTYRDRDICIVGGANSAGQGAVFFSRSARRVTMLVRSTGLETSMSQYLIDRIESLDNIEVVPHVEVAEVVGEERVEGVVVTDTRNGERRSLSCAALFLFVGSAPRSDWLAGVVERDERGFLLTGPDLPRVEGRPRGWELPRDPMLFETNIPGVFAAGDVRAGANRRVAAAVGEGSAAIYSVQRYLETV